MSESKQAPNSKNICLAIVGSRHFTDKKKFTAWVYQWVEKHGKPSMIVSGGADGADALAEEYANEHDIQLEVLPADWNTYGTRAGPYRNTQIATLCTHMLAFPSKDGTGTQDSIKKAQDRKKDVTIHFVDVPKSERIDAHFNKVNPKVLENMKKRAEKWAFLGPQKK
jgi:hypothetical protein